MLLYFAIALVGLLLLVASTVLGEVFEFLDSDGLDGGGPSPFSGKVLAIVLTVFGCAGMLTRYYDWGALLGAATSGIAAVFSGALIYWLLTALHAQTASTDVSVGSMRGRVAEVTINIPAGAVGEVLIPSAESTHHMTARSEDGLAIPAGTTVRIVQTVGNLMIVERVSVSSSASTLASAKE